MTFTVETLGKVLVVTLDNGERIAGSPNEVANALRVRFKALLAGK